MSDATHFEGQFERQLRAYATVGAPAVDREAVSRAVAAAVAGRHSRPWTARWLPRTQLAQAATVGVVLLAAVIGFGIWSGGNNQVAPPGATPVPTATARTTQPASTPSSTPSTPVPTDSPIPAALATLPPSETWSSYSSSVYGITLKYPPGWTVRPATRRWSIERDANLDLGSESYDTFTNEEGNVAVALWTVPLDVPIGDAYGLVEWAADFCEATNNAPCSDLSERKIAMCLERRDCHEAIIIPYVSDVQSYFTAGIYDHNEVTVVAVWRSDAHETTQRYGGSVQLLKDFLEPMSVFEPGPGQP